MLGAQQPADSTILVSAGFAADRFVESQAPITLNLNRVPSTSEGRLAVFIGTADLTSLFEAAGTTLAYRSNGMDLPAGESELKVFLVNGATWTELAKLTIRVLTPRGFERALIHPSAELRNTGQLAEGHSGVQPAPDRPTFQTFAATLGLQTAHERDGYALTSDTHLLAANERKDALRFGAMGDRAPRLDLADYVISLRGHGAQFTLGQVSAGTNRLLINAFASRGVTAQFGGARALWSVGAENGTSIVGADNVFGIDHGDHRIVSTSLAFEVVPERPGALHLDATALHGSLMATTGFNQGGVTSADQSDGYGLQLSASSPLQRVRLAAGLASSSSQYAADPPLSSGGSLVPNRAHRKSARYAELNVGVLQNDTVLRAIPVTLNLALRHERVDPLYRSVATPLQSDISRNGIDLGGSVDVVNVLVTLAQTSDNLNAVATLMTNRTRSSALTLGAPLAALFRVTQRANLLPTLSYVIQQMHQFGAGVPTGGVFTAADVPDLLTTVQDASALWQVRNWQMAYRVNASLQDNRQPGRELADLATQTHAVTIGLMGVSASLSLDLGLERQENKELAQVNHVRRAALTGNWRATKLTTLDGSVTLSQTEDQGAGSNAHVSSLQAGILQGLTLWHANPDAPRGQIFLRFTRQSNDLYNLSAPFAPPTQSSAMWTLASGLTLRLF